MKKLILLLLLLLLLVPPLLFAGIQDAHKSAIARKNSSVPANDRYWVGATSSWNTASNWSDTSGGLGGAGVPNSGSSVFFDSNDGTNCTADTAINISSVEVKTGYAGVFDIDGNNIGTSGNFTQLEATAIHDTTGGGLITVGGNFLITGGDGTELWLNGDFATGDTTDWTTSLSGGSTFTVASNIGTLTRGTGSALAYEGVATQGKNYVLSIDVSALTGTVDIVNNALANIATITGTGNNQTFFFRHSNSDSRIYIRAVTNGASISFDNFSLKELAVWDGPDLDVTGTAVAHWAIVTDSDASAGTSVTATDNCTDGTGNTGWNF